MLRFHRFLALITGGFAFLLVFSNASAQSDLNFPPGLEPECPIDCGSLAAAGIRELNVEVSMGGEKYLRNYCRMNGKGQVLENVVYFSDGSVNYRKEYFWEKGRLQGTMVADGEGNQAVHYLIWEKKLVINAYKEPSEDGSRLFFKYDNEDRLVEIRKGKVRKGSKSMRIYQYDGEGNLTLDSVLLGPSKGVVKHFRYDDRGRLIHDDHVSWREGYSLQSEVDYSYYANGLVQEEKIGGPGNGGMLHRFKYDGEGRVIQEEWLDLEGNMAEQMNYTFSRDGMRSDSKIYREFVTEEPFAIGFERMNEDGLPEEISLKEMDGGQYLWIYQYEK